jgi:hypothetical protein
MQITIDQLEHEWEDSVFSDLIKVGATQSNDFVCTSSE